MKKQVAVIGLTLLLLMIGLSGCVENQLSEQAASNINDLGYRWYGFGINPPGEGQIDREKTQWKTNWTFNQSINGISFILEDEDLVYLSISSDYGFGRGASTIGSNYRYYFSIQYPYTDQTVSEYGSNFMAAPILRDLYPNLSFISNETTTVNNLDAYITIFSYDWGNISTITKRVFVEKHGIVFRLDYTASEDLFEHYLEVVDKSMATFTIQ